MLNVQEFLFGITVTDGLEPDFALSLLTEEYGIKVKKYDDRVVLNYCQISSTKNHPIADECRGLILSYPEFNVIAKGYNRFYNLTENGFDGPANWNDWAIQEKVDGSLIHIYHYNGEWEATTRGTAFGESIMAGATFKYYGKDNMSYREGVLRTLFPHIPKSNPLSNCEDMFQSWCCTNAILNPDYTYCFEYCSPANRIVTPYTEHSMVLHGVFNNNTGDFMHDEFNDWKERVNQLRLHNATVSPIDVVKEYKCSSMEEMHALLDSLTGLEEGFVCVNNNPSNGEPHRIKIKHPQYLIVHRVRGNGELSLKDAIELYIDDGGSEYLSYFPEDKSLIDQVDAAYKDLVYDMAVTYNQSHTIELQKDFALMVAPTPYSAILFQCRAKKLHPTVAFDSAKDSLKFKLIELYWNKLKTEGELD